MKKDFFKYLSVLFLVLTVFLVSSCDNDTSSDSSASSYDDLYDISWGYTSDGTDVIYIFNATGYSVEIVDMRTMEYTMTTEVLTGTASGQTTFTFSAKTATGTASDKVITIVDDDNITFKTGDGDPTAMTRLETEE